MEMGLKKQIHGISPGRESEDILGGGTGVNKGMEANAGGLGECHYCALLKEYDRGMEFSSREAKGSDKGLNQVVTGERESRREIWRH